MAANLDGFRKKIDGLKALDTVARNFPKDAASYMKERLNMNVMDGQYVGRISGMLRRSHQIFIAGPYVAEVKHVPGVAPYGKWVYEWSLRKYGKSYIQILLDLYGPSVNRAAKLVIGRMVQRIRSGASFTYVNPFPS